jgi:putative chitinase
MRRSPKQWYEILVQCQVKPLAAAPWSTIFAEVIDDKTFSAGEDELVDFLGQILHESGRLERLEESLYYSTPGRLMAVWPSRFKSLADELPFLNNPVALANKVYGGRMGNTDPYDGWRNRGSGLIQITGADNLRKVQSLTGIPVYNNPDLLRKPTADCLRVCIAWWEGTIPDSAVGDVKRITRLVNGGTAGLSDRIDLTNKAKEALA